MSGLALQCLFVCGGDQISLDFKLGPSPRGQIYISQVASELLANPFDPMRPLLGLTIAAFERLFKAASASEVIHQPSLQLRTADMLTATVHRASLPGMPQQLHVRYAIFLITDGNSRQTERVKSVWQNSNQFSAGYRARAYQVCSNCAGNLANEATTATSRNEVSLGCDAACWIVYSSSAVLLNHLYSALFHTLEPTDALQ